MSTPQEHSHQWAEKATQLLIECIKVPNRAEMHQYLQWTHVADLINEQWVARGYPPNTFTAASCEHRYSEYLIFAFGPADFRADTIGVEHLPWNVNQLRQLAIMIPSRFASGKFNSNIYLDAPADEPDWDAIAQAMRGASLRLYISPYTVRKAWGRRLVLDHHMDLSDTASRQTRANLRRQLGC